MSTKESKNQIFISYRKIGGGYVGKILYDRLTKRGYKVFFDVESLRSGHFDAQIYSKIDECEDFLLILSPGALDRCNNEDDWVKNEILYALQHNKNIVPILMRGFEWPDIMPKELEKLPSYENETLSSDMSDEHLDASINVLCRRLLKAHVDPASPKDILRRFLLKYLIVVLLISVIIIWPKDDIQQQSFTLAKEAYAEMNLGNYEIALQKFYLYEHGHSFIYWKLMDLFNGKNEYCYDNIQEAISYCEEQLKND